VQPVFAILILAENPFFSSLSILPSDEPVLTVADQMYFVEKAEVPEAK
jgi:hypothetical protein